MSTLAVRVGAPLMSWGDRSTFRTRHTAPDPTLSAIQGLLAAAAGVGRGADLPGWIAQLEPVIRLDRPGRTLRDYHTVNPFDPGEFRALDGLSDADRKQLVNLVTASGTPDDRTIETQRFYRTDAEYLVCVDDPDGTIERILRRPVWTLYAGRKACPLTAPLLIGRVDAAPSDAVCQIPTVDVAADPDARVARKVIRFDRPSVGARTAHRRDRLVRTGHHVRQDRWYDEATVPVASSWFDVIDLLDTSGVKDR